MSLKADQMCFGLTDELDRQSLACFLQLAGEQEFAETLAQRLSGEEILEFVDSFTKLLRKHLNEDEYHALFLQDKDHSHD